jgi:hypothetical protein
MRHLSQRVNARVGPAGAVKLEVFAAADRSCGLIDLALNRPRVLLDLPPALAGSGVLDGQLESWHGHILRLRAQGSRLSPQRGS